jgi:hypothetical protein
MKRAMITRIGLLSGTLFVMSQLACKSPSSSPADGAAPAASVDPSAMRRVSAADCDQWADHGAEVVVSAFKEAARDCPDKIRDDVRTKFVDQRSSIRDGARAFCERHLDEAYRTADGACFLAATGARALTACKLGPMTNRDDSDWVEMTEQLRRRCEERPSPAPSPTL